MKSSVTRVIAGLVVPAIAALGGAAVVFSEIDDAPGGVLLGILLILGAVAVNMRAARR